MNLFRSAAAVLVVGILAACATVPPPAASAPPAQALPEAAPAPAPEAAPVVRTITYQEALPSLVTSYYPNGDRSGSVTTQYDERGALVLQQKANGNGLLTETKSGKAKGTVWRITVTNAQTGEVTGFEDLTLDANGVVLVQTFLNPKEVPQASNEYTYDAAGRKTLWLAKTGTGVLQARTVYSYDAQGNNVKKQVFDAGGTLTNVYVGTFDAQGHQLTEVGSDGANNVVEQTNFTWKDGRLQRAETVKPLLRSLDYSYGDKDAPTAIVTSVRGKVVERQTLEYRWFTRTKNAP